MTAREYGLLHFLMRNAGDVVSKAEILDNVWDSAYEGSDNIVEVYIGYLRRKIDVSVRAVDPAHRPRARLPVGSRSRLRQRHRPLR